MKMSDMDEALVEIQARLDASSEGTWGPYFDTHADPYVITDPVFRNTRRVAKVWTSPPDYGRADALLLGNAKRDITFLTMLVNVLLDLDVTTLAEITTHVPEGTTIRDAMRLLETD